MFFWKKKPTETLDLSWLHADMHSHLLPGIDDGADDMATSLQMITGLQKLGLKKLITTPHILGEIYPNTKEGIREKAHELKGVLAAENINMEVYAAAEYYIDGYFEYELKRKTPLLTLKDNLVLVEISMITAPLDLQKVLFELQLQNYQPVIAHPERYIYLRSRKEFFDELKNIGCYFQLNLLSLTGHYGASVQELAEYLLKMDYYDYAGTDLHNPKQLTALQSLSKSPAYARLKDSAQIKNHLL
ncbi:MAG: hypothetical protein M3342_21085 [Bacteroidota bacterium]|nr:hypothetical protein [Bacteroidota bacterium]